jgi:endonuclease YncB( thermonuclease family)
MKIRILSIAIFLCLFSVSAFAQTYTGKITKVIDGRTAVLAVTNGTISTIQMQYIEVPEPEQQLSGTVKGHLEKLVLGKEVKFFYHDNYSQG